MYPVSFQTESLIYVDICIVSNYGLYLCPIMSDNMEFDMNVCISLALNSDGFMGLRK